LRHNLREKFKRLRAEVSSLSITWDEVAQKSKDFASKMKWVSAGIIAGAGYALKAASSHEALAISFEMLGLNAVKAKKFVDELYKIALDLPVIDEQSVFSSAKMLINMGQGAEQAAKRVKMLAAISVATEIPLESLVETVGKMERQGFVSPRAFMSLNKLGLDKMLAEKFGVSIKEILTAAGKKAIPAAAAIEVLEKRAESYGDALSRMDAQFNEQIGDTIVLLKLHAASFGEALAGIFGFNGGLKELNNWLDQSLSKSKEFYKEHSQIIKIAAGFAAFLIALTPIAMMISVIAVSITLSTNLFIYFDCLRKREHVTNYNAFNL